MSMSKSASATVNAPDWEDTNYTVNVNHARVGVSLFLRVISIVPPL